MSGRFVQSVCHFGSLPVAAWKVFVFQKISYASEAVKVTGRAAQTRAGQLHHSFNNVAAFWGFCDVFKEGQM